GDRGRRVAELTDFRRPRLLARRAGPFDEVGNPVRRSDVGGCGRIGARGGVFDPEVRGGVGAGPGSLGAREDGVELRPSLGIEDGTLASQLVEKSRRALGGRLTGGAELL